MANNKNRFILQSSGYTPEIDSLGWEEKGKMLTAIYAKAGAEYATMPELSPLLRMALSPIFMEMDKTQHYVPEIDQAWVQVQLEIDERQANESSKEGM